MRGAVRVRSRIEGSRALTFEKLSCVLDREPTRESAVESPFPSTTVSQERFHNLHVSIALGVRKGRGREPVATLRGQRTATYVGIFPFWSSGSQRLESQDTQIRFPLRSRLKDQGTPRYEGIHSARLATSVMTSRRADLGPESIAKSGHRRSFLVSRNMCSSDSVSRCASGIASDYLVQAAHARSAG